MLETNYLDSSLEVIKIMSCVILLFVLSLFKLIALDVVFSINLKRYSLNEIV